MPQAKINAFFKPTSAPLQRNPARLLSCDSFSDPSTPTSDVQGRPPSRSSGGCFDDDDVKRTQGSASDEREKGDGSPVSACIPSNNSLAEAPAMKKRRYAQYHLELGQSDFLLHSCSLCGLMYACGDEEDEKLHKTFHKNYYQGIGFKGWRDERVVSSPKSNKDRILMVKDTDHPAQKQKVKQVLKTVEKELGFGDDHLLHKLCKVYLYISGHRIVGCLVTEPIRTAHRVVSSSSCKQSNSANRESESIKMQHSEAELKKQSPTMQFGGFSFRRDVKRKVCATSSHKVDQLQSGAILCEEEALPAFCGFKAIWVVPSQRRKHIASQLLDAARKSFLEGQILEPSQCAFSSPTSAGRALASSYNNSNAFLIYREDDI